jgi:PadR family transcriptional regulator PadR
MNNSAELYEKWKSQFRKGFLELCILCTLQKRGRGYGLELMETLSSAGIVISEGTLYPLLMRLTKDGSIVASWEMPDVGHPRKYYTLTDIGKQLCSEMMEEYVRSYSALTVIGGKVGG